MIIVMIIDVSCFSSILTSSYRTIINENGLFLLLFRVQQRNSTGSTAIVSLTKGLGIFRNMYSRPIYSRQDIVQDRG